MLPGRVCHLCFIQKESSAHCAFSHTERADLEATFKNMLINQHQVLRETFSLPP